MVKKFGFAFLLMVPLSLFGADKAPVNIPEINKAIGKFSEYEQLFHEGKTVKANKAYAEGLKILRAVFKKGMVITTDKTYPFAKWDRMDSFTLNNVDEKINGYRLVFNYSSSDFGGNASVKTPDSIMEKLQDVPSNFTGRVQLVESYSDGMVFVDGNWINIYCKILSVSPIKEDN